MNLFNKIKLDKPLALSLDEWEYWHESNKSKYPIRYFITETIPKIFRKYLYSKYNYYILEGIIWKFKYTFIKKYQYHIIRPKSLKPGYHDPCDLILHSAFDLLSDFVEYHYKYKHTNWSYSKHANDQWLELNRLYFWWKYQRPNRYNKLDKEYPYPAKPDGYPSMWCLMDKYTNTPEYKEWSRISKIRNSIEENFLIEDENKLIRLMKIRSILWY